MAEIKLLRWGKLDVVNAPCSQGDAHTLSSFDQCGELDLLPARSRSHIALCNQTSGLCAAWFSLAGLYCLSKWMTCVAAVRVRPTPPAWQAEPGSIVWD